MPTSTQSQALATMTKPATASKQQQQEQQQSTRPGVVVLHIGSLFAWFDCSGNNSSNASRIVVPRFGVEQVVAYLKEQQQQQHQHQHAETDSSSSSSSKPLVVFVVVPGKEGVKLLAGVQADPSLASLLEGLSIIVTKAEDGEEALAGLRQGMHNLMGEKGNNDQSSSISASLSWPFLKALLNEDNQTIQLSSSIEHTTVVIGLAPASSSSTSSTSSSPSSLVAEIISHIPPGSSSSSSSGYCSHDDPSLLLPPSSQPPPGPRPVLLPSLLHQQTNLPDLSHVNWPLLGLPSLVVDVQNPPFLWPRDYERAAGPAREVEARWWDPQHGQLNLILGRGVNVGNALEVVAAETRRRTGGGKEGGERMEGLESVFVTVRHDFGVMARLLADGYRIHHAAGGGTQVVLLRRYVKVEVPTAGTHICRSKVILFRRRKRGRTEGVPQEEEEGGMEDEGEVEVFFFRRRAKGIYKMPGGHVELKELAEEAAVREVWEETGYACRVVGMVALTERKDVGKKWGCSQLMFTFAAEWVESEMRLDDAVSREGKWFLLEEVDAMVAKDSAALDPPLKKVWPAFRAGGKALAMPAAAAAGAAVGPAAWFCHHPNCIDVGYETRKRCYMVGGEGGEGGREGEVQLPPGQLQLQQDGGQMQGGKGGGRGGLTASTSSLSSSTSSSSSSSFVAYHHRGNVSESCNSLSSCFEGGNGNDWEGRSSSENEKNMTHI